MIIKSNLLMMVKIISKDVNDNLLKNLVKENLLSATSNFNSVADLDCISICVPTPLNKEKIQIYHTLLQ